MIRIKLGAIGMSEDMRHIIAYNITNAGMVLPIVISRLSAVNFEIEKENREFTVYHTPIEVAKKMGAQIDHFILGVVDEQRRKTVMIVYSQDDILRENPIEIQVNADFAVGVSYFYDIPMYVDEEIKSSLASEEDLDEDIRKVIHSPQIMEL